MKIPKTFLPEKDLEEKLKQLSEEKPKTQEKNLSLKIEKEELDKALEKIRNVRDHEVFSEIRPLLEKTGYTLMENKKRYEYWIKPAMSDEKYLFIRVKDKTKHYTFSIVEENNLEKFCQKFEYENKRIPLNIFLTTVAIAVGATSSAYLPFYLKAETQILPIVGILGAIVIFFAGICSMEYMQKYTNEKNKKDTEKYCIRLIRNEGEALKWAFS